MHWLPRSLLDRFCKMAYGHPFDLILFNYWQLRALWQGFEWHDYTALLAYEPWRFTDRMEPYPLTHLVPRRVAARLGFLLPNFNWVLIKERG